MRFLKIILSFVIFFLLFSLGIRGVFSSSFKEKIDLSKLSSEMKLPNYDTKDILFTLNEKLSDKVIGLVTSDDSEPSQQAALLILRKSIRNDFIDYVFRQAPFELSEQFLKIIVRSSSLLNQDSFSDAVGSIEKMSVKESLDYIQNYFIQNKEKVSFGALKVIPYTSIFGHIQNPNFQYIIISKSGGEPDQVNLLIKVYCPSSLEPIKNTASFGGNGSWEQDLWLQEGKSKLSPFIITISGAARIDSAGKLNGQFIYNYDWISQPDIEVVFSKSVPDFGFKPTSFWRDKITSIKESIEKKIESAAKLNFRSLGEGLKNIFYRSGNSSSSRASLKDSFHLAENKSDKQNRNSSQPVKTENKTNLSSSTTAVPKGKNFSTNLNLALNSPKSSSTKPVVKRRVSLVSPKPKLATTTKKIVNKPFVKSRGKNEKQELEENLSLPKLLIAGVCVGFDKSSDEFIELYNPNSKPVSLDSKNFEIEITNSNNESTKKEIRFSSNVIPSKAYFLLVGGEIRADSYGISPDAHYSSQLSGTGGIIIRDGEGNILDRVSWGKKPPESATEVQGIFIPDGLKTGQEIIRRKDSQGNFIDSDNNSFDFVLSNTLSPINSLGERLVYKKETAPSKNSSQDSNKADSNSDSRSQVDNGGSGNNEGSNNNNNNGADNNSSHGFSSSTVVYPKILITEVQLSSPSSSRDEFIELYNPSDKDVFLDNWYIQKKTKNSSSFNSFISRNLLKGKTVPSKNYFLIANVSSTYSSLADVVFPSHYSLANDNTIVFKNPYKNVVDKLGWGEAKDFEGEAAPNPQPGLSLSRLWSSSSQRYIDTDNNLGDFVRQAPTPRGVNVISDDGSSTNEVLSLVLTDQTDLDNDGIPDFMDTSTIVTSSLSLPAGNYIFKNLVLKGTNLTLLSSPSKDGFKGVKIQADNLFVDASSSISADGKGYPAHQGPGAAQSKEYSGGSYGGQGGSLSSNKGNRLIYGNLFEPSDLGSGAGGPGGGAIELDISGTSTINGIISANGLKSIRSNQSGAGSGGSIYIKTKKLEGRGFITANGGNNDAKCCRTGGGGRIAIYYTNNSFPPSHIETYSGQTGGEVNCGGAGTIFLKKNSQFKGDLIISNGGRMVRDKTILPGSQKYIFDNVKIEGGGDLELNTDLTVLNKMEVNNARIDFNNTSTVTSSQLSFKHSFLSGPPRQTIYLNVGQEADLINGQWNCNLNLSANNLVVDTSSSISADGKGYSANRGPGEGKKYSGGSHGGQGGGIEISQLGGLYENGEKFCFHPIDFGSGGYSSPSAFRQIPSGSEYGNGGGRLSLNLSGLLTLNGLISANGSESDGHIVGAGSGGSIYIRAKNIEGKGYIEANGGEDNTSYYWAGGGGVIGLDLGSKDILDSAMGKFSSANIRVDPGEEKYEIGDAKIKKAQKGVICLKLPK